MSIEISETTVQEFLRADHVKSFSTPMQLAAISLGATQRAQMLQVSNADHSLNFARLARFFGLDSGVVSASLAEAQTLRPYDYEILLEQTDYLLSAQQYSAALTSAQKLAELYPKDSIAVRKLARLNELNGDQTQAIGVLREYLVRESSALRHPDNRVLSELSVLLVRAGRLNESLQVNLRLAEQIPDSISVVKNIVALAIRLGKVSLAQQWCAQRVSGESQNERNVLQELAILCDSLPNH